MLTSRMKGLFLESVPRDVCRAIGELVIEQYGLTADEAEARWLADEAADIISPLRRVHIESGLVRLRGLFPGLVTVEGRKNQTNNASHREVYCAGWAITQSKIEHPGGPIRKAEFRETLATASQMTMAELLGEVAPPLPSSDAQPWACVAHMPAVEQVDQPGVLKVAFPLPDGMWEDAIDLYLWIPELRRHAESEYVLELRDRERRRWAV